MKKKKTSKSKKQVALSPGQAVLPVISVHLSKRPDLTSTQPCQHGAINRLTGLDFPHCGTSPHRRHSSIRTMHLISSASDALKHLFLTVRKS